MPTLRQLLHGEPPSNSGPVRVDFVPGSRSAYSGAGYWVLQQLLQDVTGQPFAEFLQQAVLAKLGMDHSTFQQPLPPVHASAAATGHDPAGNQIEEPDSRHPGLADGGLWTTPSDLARFLIEVQLSYAGRSNQVLSQAMAQQMLTDQMGNHGLGLHTFGEGETLRLSHGGSGEAFHCLMAAFRGTGQGAVAMTNGANGFGLIEELFRALAEVYGWPDYGAVGRRIADVDPDNYTAYEGTYRLTEEVERYGDYTGQWQVNHMPEVLFAVRRDGEKLLIRDPVGDERQYYPRSPITFFAPQNEGEITFVKGGDGRARQIELVYRYTSFRAWRVNSS